MSLYWSSRAPYMKPAWQALRFGEYSFRNIPKQQARFPKNRIICNIRFIQQQWHQCVELAPQPATDISVAQWLEFSVSPVIKWLRFVWRTEIVLLWVWALRASIHRSCRYCLEACDWRNKLEIKRENLIVKSRHFCHFYWSVAATWRWIVGF